MTFNVAMLKQMREEGLSLDACIRVLEAGEDQPSPAAIRQARYRAKKRNGSDVTRDVTPPLNEEDNLIPPSSEAIASGGEPPADPVKELFDVGVSVLKAAAVPEKQARSLIGKWRKAKSDGEVLTGLLECRNKAISSPVEWLTKRFEGGQYISPSGYQYRGDARTVMREAERRADWGTYWKAKGDAEGRYAATG